MNGLKKGLEMLIIASLFSGCSAFQTIGRQWKSDISKPIAKVVETTKNVGYGIGTGLVYNPKTKNLGLIPGTVKIATGATVGVVTGVTSITDNADNALKELSTNLKFCYGGGKIYYTTTGRKYKTAFATYDIKKGGSLDNKCNWVYK